MYKFLYFWVRLAVIVFAVTFGAYSDSFAQKPLTPVTPSFEPERPFVLLIQAADTLEHSFWFRGIDQHARKTAEALNIDIEHLFTGDDRSAIPNKIRNYIRNERKPDYILFANQIEIGPSILKLSDELGIKSFMFSSPLSPQDTRVFGEPREKIAGWVGQIMPDDEAAGFDLGNTLIERARSIKGKTSDTEKIRIIGISGTSLTQASALRTKGLLRAVEMHADVELLQVVSARWAPEVAAQKYKLLVSRYGEVDVVWAANDDMALAILEESRDLQKIPVIGGFDWTPPAIEAIQKGEFWASMGGHDFEVAYALKIIREYHEGQDFSKISGTTSLSSKLDKLTPENVDQLSEFLKMISRDRMDYSQGLETLLEDKEDYSNMSIAQFKKNIETNRQDHEAIPIQ